MEYHGVREVFSCSCSERLDSEDTGVSVAIILRLPILGHSTCSVTVLNIYTVAIFHAMRCAAGLCRRCLARGLGTDVGAER